MGIGLVRPCPKEGDASHRRRGGRGGGRGFAGNHGRTAREGSVGNAAHLRARQPDSFLMKPTAIVTGGRRGIGRAIATELARTHRVIATWRGRKDAADSLREETGCEIFQCEIASREDRAALLAFARQRFEKLDLLVNNAGMAPRERRDLLEASEDSLDELMATNLKGPHFLTQQAARWMAA